MISYEELSDAIKSGLDEIFSDGISIDRVWCSTNYKYDDIEVFVATNVPGETKQLCVSIYITEEWYNRHSNPIDWIVDKAQETIFDEMDLVIGKQKG